MNDLKSKFFFLKPSEKISTNLLVTIGLTIWKEEHLINATAFYSNALFQQSSYEHIHICVVNVLRKLT